MTANNDTVGRDMPQGLRRALEERGARIGDGWTEGKRRFVVADSRAGPLFARFSVSPLDREVFAYETAVRRLVGDTGDLRSPPILARGDTWLLEARIVPEPFAGSTCVDRAVAAAQRIAELTLPEAPGGRESRVARAWRRVRTAASPLPLRDVIAARRVVRSSALPLVTAHGDFHVQNLLFDGVDLWVFDWELAGHRPAGYDLMHLWATLDADADRQRLFEAATDLIGSRQALLELRFAVAVSVVVNLTQAAISSNRRPEDGRKLLALLPSLRAEAGL